MLRYAPTWLIGSYFIYSTAVMGLEDYLPHGFFASVLPAIGLSMGLVVLLSLVLPAGWGGWLVAGYSPSFFAFLAAALVTTVVTFALNWLVLQLRERV